MAREFEERNQKATASVATIVGITIASMMPVALNRMSRSAEAMGPFGLRTPSLQPPSVAAPITTRASRADRILDLLCPETGGTARGADQQLGAATACTTAGA